MIISKSNRLQTVTEYYFSNKLKEIDRLKTQGHAVLNIGIGSPDLPPPKAVLETISKAALQDNVHAYQSYQGTPELRNAIQKFYQKNYDTALHADTEILPLMGSKEGIMLISLAFLNQGDAVLIPNPGYPTYTSATKLVQAKPIFYKLSQENNWFPDLKELEKENLENVKIMWLNYPNMPTGKLATKKLFTELISFAKKHKILLVNDNPYSFILNKKPMSILTVPDAKSVAIELNSLSKSFNISGWRVGMALGKKEYLKAILQVKSNMDSGMFYGIQKGAITALNLDTDWFEKLNETYRFRRKIVWKILDKLNCTYSKNSVGLFVWAKLPKNKKAIEFTDDLLQNKKVFITPGTVFGTNGEGYIRVSLCASENMLTEILNRLN